MDFYMIQTEQQLKKIIKETLLLSETGRQLDGVINDLQFGFTDTHNGNGEDTLKDANDNDNPFAQKIIHAVRKNNTLLELILLLIEIPSAEFKEFYKKSKLLSDKEAENIAFLEKQETARKKDLNKCKNLIEIFISNIKGLKDTEQNVPKKFISYLTTLKKDLNKYVPTWHVLQYIFFNVSAFVQNGDGEIDKILYEFCKNNDNFKTPITKIKAFQIPNVSLSNLLKEVKENINNTGLNEDDKQIILSDMVGCDDFSEGIERGEWGWLTGAIDTAVNFFFPDIRSITSEIEDFFEKFEKTAGGKKNLQKLMDKLTGDVSIKGLLKKMGAGNITQEDIEKAASTIENMRMSAGLNAWNSGDEGE